MNFLYSKRVWLNESHLPSTGSVVAYHGDVAYPDGVDKSVAFLEIADCHGKVRLHFTPTDSMSQFIHKMETLKSVIDDFITHLKADPPEGESSK